MKSLLNNKDILRKEVKKMKVRYLGILVVALMLALTLKTSALAVDPITTQNSWVVSAYKFNLFGVGIGGTQISSTKTITTLSGVEQSTNTQTNTTALSYLGGSLKADSVAVTGNSTNKDTSSSTTSGTIDYVYNTNGQLASASGNITSTQNGGTDALNQAIGHSTSTTTDAYMIKNGQAVQSGSVTNGTAYAADGTTVMSRSNDTAVIVNQLVKGEWVVMSETTYSKNSGGASYGEQRDGVSWSNTTTTRTYTRDGTGKITSINQIKSGTQNNYSASTNGNQKQEIIPFNDPDPKKAYKATFTFDNKRGWVLTDLQEGWRDTN